MFATVFMDVEDLISLDSDDTAKTCAEILTEEGIQATLCVVGEKARLQKQRGRQDVIEALLKHDIGVHTDLHSVHPTIAEYLGDKDWESGVKEALVREKPGVEAIRDVFGVNPSCWGGPGNTWGPQICEAIRLLGVPAFVYAHTDVPEGNPHRFQGILAYPDGRHTDDTQYHDAVISTQVLDKLEIDLQNDSAGGRYWGQIFIGHPTRILHEEFWDAPNFSKGKNPPRSEWISARRKSKHNLDCALDNFRRTVQRIKQFSFIELRTIREMNAMLMPLPSSPISNIERDNVWPRIEANLHGMTGWPILPDGFDVSQICTLTKSRLPTLERIAF